MLQEAIRHLHTRLLAQHLVRAEWLDDCLCRVSNRISKLQRARFDQA